jgi:hypothetical protein
MSTDLDTTRIVRSWLQTDEHESADRVLDDVIALLDTTPQRPSWWPARRSPRMNALSKFAIAAAAVVAIAIVGINLLPRTGGDIGGVPTAVPSPTPTPAPSVSATLAPSFPPAGDLAIGRHSMVREGVKLSFAVSTPGWQSGDGIWIDKGEGGKPGSSAIIFWQMTPDNVYADPCSHARRSPAPEHTAAGLAAAVAGIPGVDVVSGPTSMTIGGHPAQHVQLAIPAAIGCAPDQFYLWFDSTDGTGRWAQATDETLWVWIVDVDGTLVWMDGETYKGADATVIGELQQIIDSIQFE